MALYVVDGYVDEGYVQTGVTVLWGPKIIFVPKIAMVQIQTTPTEIWQLDIPQFKETLADLLDDADGIIFPDIFNHNPSVSVGGAVLAKVVEILEPYTVTFEDGQYAVNLVGANSNIGDRVNVNQVSVRSANSAGLQDLSSLQAASFDSMVSIDQVNGTPGTVFPIGTKGTPVKSVTDARIIMAKNNINILYIIGALTLDTGDDVSNIIILGQNPTKTLIVINTGADTAGCEIREATVGGVLDGGTVLRECVVYTINYVNGFLVDCVLGNGTITLGGGATALLMRCVSGVPGLSTPTIDMGGSGQSLGMRDYNGGIKIINKTGSDPFSLDVNSGQVILDPTVTNGTLVCRGVGKLKDFSTGTAVVINEMLNGAEVANTQKLIELQSDSHSGLGKVWYWDPYAGNDANEGDHASRAVATFAQAHTLAGSGRGDVIIALTTDPDGHTISTENITISKDDIMVRGQGESFEIKSANDLLDGVTITGHGVELSGMTLSTSPTNTRHCVYITGPNTLVKNVVLSDAADGIDIAAGEYTVIKNVKAHHNAGYGIKVGGTAQHIDIIDCHIGGNGGDGIVLEGTDPHEVVISGETVIHKNQGYGINIGANMTNVTIGSDVSVFHNVLGGINDLGTDTKLLTPASEVWNAELPTGTAGDVLNRSSYIGGKVYIDTEAVSNGNGSQASPFNTFNDAKDYAEANGIYTMVVHGEVTIPSAFKNFTVIGIGTPLIHLNGQDLKGSKFYQCSLSGTYTNSIIGQECVLHDGMLLNGFFEKSMLLGGMVCTSVSNVLVVNCFSGIAGTGRPTLSLLGVTNCKVSVRNYSGGLSVLNCTDIDNEVTVDMHQGALTLENTCTAGTLVARGICKFVDNSAGTTVVDETIAHESLRDGLATTADTVVASQL